MYRDLFLSLFMQLRVDFSYKLLLLFEALTVPNYVVGAQCCESHMAFPVLQPLRLCSLAHGAHGSHGSPIAWARPMP